MKDPQSEELIRATEKCVKESQELLRKLRADVRYDDKYLSDIQRIIDELNLAFKHEVKEAD